MKCKWTLPAFFVAAFALRASSLFRSVLNWDESLYMLIARSMLQGSAPYTAIWNNTPPGIYAIFAPVLFVFPDSVPAIRILTCIVVGLTAFALYRLALVLSEGDHALGFIAGGLYVLYSSSPVMGGLASNTELFYIPFTVWGFSALLASKGALKDVLAGLLFGAGFQIKYHVAFDFLAALVVTGVSSPDSRGKLGAAARRWGPMLSGFLLPFVGVIVCFMIAGHAPEYVDSAILANLTYFADGRASLRRSFGIIVDQVFAHPLLWVSAVYVGLGLVRERAKTREESSRSFALIWFAASLLGVLATRRSWDHYFLQTLPAMCLLASYSVLDVLRVDMTTLRRAALVIIVLFSTSMLNPARANLVAASWAAYQRYIIKTDEWKDTPLRIAEYLNERTESSDSVYVVDYEPVIYLLVHAQCPTRYPFPDHLTNPDLTPMTGIDPVDELRAIMRKTPLYVIRKRTPDYGPSTFYLTLDEYIAGTYVHETSFRDGEDVDIDLYRFDRVSLD